MKHDTPTAEELERGKQAAANVAAAEAEAPPEDNPEEDSRYFQWTSGFAHSNGEWAD